MRKEEINIVLGMIILLIVVTIGYATLQTSLTINGTLNAKTLVFYGSGITGLTNISIRPIITINANIKFGDGNGSFNNPYTLVK